MTVEQLSIFVENEPGDLALLLDVPCGRRVDPRTPSLPDTAAVDVIRLEAPEEAVALLRAPTVRSLSPS